MDEKLDIIIKELKKITEMLYQNDNQTEYIYKAFIENKSASQQSKDFMFNVLANITADFITAPK